MCWYQPNPPYCTCTFYQLIQPCPSASCYPAPSPSQNPRPLIVACNIMWYAVGVGARSCVSCLGRYRRVGPPAFGHKTGMPVGKDTEKSADPLMGSGSGAGMGSEMVDLGTSAYPDVLDGWSSFTAMLHGDMGDSKALTLTPTQMHLQASAPDLDPLQRQTQVRSTAQTQTQAHSQQNPEQDWEHNLEQELMRGMATKFGCRYPAGTLVSMSPERLVSLSGVKKKTSESGLEPVAPYKKLARRVTLPCLLEGEVVRDVRIRAQTEEAMRGLDEGMQRERESTGADGAGDAVGGGDGDGDDDGWLILVSLDGDYAEKEDKDSEIFLEIFSEDETEDEGVVV